MLIQFYVRYIDNIKRIYGCCESQNKPAANPFSDLPTKLLTIFSQWSIGLWLPRVYKSTWIDFPTRYPADRIKISYLDTLLEGPALRWFNPIIEQPGKFETHLQTWSTLVRLDLKTWSNFKTYIQFSVNGVERVESVATDDRVAEVLKKNNEDFFQKFKSNRAWILRRVRMAIGGVNRLTRLKIHTRFDLNFWKKSSYSFSEPLQLCHDQLYTPGESHWRCQIERVSMEDGPSALISLEHLIHEIYLLEHVESVENIPNGPDPLRPFHILAPQLANPFHESGVSISSEKRPADVSKTRDSTP
jgi:hypothetical protein